MTNKTPVTINLTLSLEEVYMLRMALMRAKQSAEEQIPLQKDNTSRWKLQQMSEKYMNLSASIGKETERQLHERWEEKKN